MQPRPANEGDRARGRIVVAEDDQELRRLVADVLRRAGHTVVEAASGTELTNQVLAQAIHETVPIDLVIADICMPGASGLQVLADLFGREWAPPVVLMTTGADRVTARRASRLGAAALLDKPVDLDALRELVADLLGVRRDGAGLSSAS